MRSRNYTKLGITGTLLLLGSIPSIAACTADTAGGSAFTCSGTDTTIQIGLVKKLRKQLLCCQ